nr:TIGR04255 family protein [Nitrosomonas nitrosa]
MTSNFPQVLRNSPLREVIFQLRFIPSQPEAGDLLPGLLYPALHKEYSDMMTLPVATVPRQIRNQNPEMRYMASHRFSSGSHSVQIGDHSVLLQTTEYPGWSEFKNKVVTLLDALKKTEIVKQVERFSFKYINLIAASESERQLQFLKVHIELSGRTPNEKGFLLREESIEGKFITVTQVAPNTTAKVSTLAHEISGLLIDVDTIRQVGNEFWTDHVSLLEEGHAIAKRNFFSLLTEATLQKLEPK